MTTTMLALPASVRMAEAPRLWAGLSASLRAEAAQVRSAAGTRIELDATELADFDSSALTLLLSAARLCKDEGVSLQLHGLPPRLQELARVYGVEELLNAA